MARPSLITQWLADPNAFSAEDKEELAALIAEQPYFVPARLVKAAQQHRQEAYAPAMMNSVQLFSGNWLMTYQYLDACEALPVVEEVPEPQEAESREAAQQEADIMPVAPALEEVTPVLEDVPVAEEPVAAQPEPVAQQPEPVAIATETPAEIPVQIVQDYIPQEVPVEVPQEQPAPEPMPEPEPAPKPAYQQPKPERKPIGDEQMVKPLFTQDYFLAQGIEIPEVNQPELQEDDQDKSLMVVMSFSEWLMFYKTKNERDKQEQEDKKALKSMWQKEKLAAALEEENEEIPETVFNMAVSSITKEEDLISESLAEVLQKQGKYDKALDMYRKLSLRNPQKSAYFASKIEQINKQIDS